MPGHEPLPFEPFLELLRREGFAIGIEHRVRLQQVIEKAAPRWPQDRLSRMLCPLFATNEREQGLFYRAFESYFAPSVPAPPLRPPLPPEPEPLQHRAGVRLMALILALSLIIAVLWPMAVLPPQNDEPTTAAQTPNPKKRKSAVTNDEAPASGIEKEVEPVLQRWRPSRSVLLSVSLLVPLVAFGFAESASRRRCRAVLARIRQQKPVFSWPLVIEPRELRDFRSDGFYRTARKLRRRHAIDGRRLDLPATIAATISFGGCPHFIFRPDSRVPEYLILIERAAWHDHAAAFYDQLSRALDREGLFVVRYFFQSDPRACELEDGTGGVRMAELQKRYPDHRLILITEGEALFDPITGRFADWVTLLDGWRSCSVLSTAPAGFWGERERLLAARFFLAPATLQGLDSLAEAWGVFETGAFAGRGIFARSGWRYSETADEESLRSQLGPGVFAWLCACAIHPELDWDLTLHLGACLSTELLTEDSILLLTRLPWFRSGQIPRSWRRRLVAALPSEQQQAIRREIIRLLELSPAPDGTIVAARRRLEVAIQRSHIAAPDAKQDTVRELVEAAVEAGEPVHDVTVVSEAYTARPPLLSIFQPSRPRLPARGTPFFGWRTAERLVVAALAASFFAGVSILTTQPERPVTPAPSTPVPAMPRKTSDLITIPPTWTLQQAQQALNAEEKAFKRPDGRITPAQLISFSVDQGETTNVATFEEEAEPPFRPVILLSGVPTDPDKRDNFFRSLGQRGLKLIVLSDVLIEGKITEIAVCRSISEMPATALDSPGTPQIAAPPNVTTLNGRTYPWKKNIVTLIFWIGESASANNAISNYASSWDLNWAASYGGFDNPDPAARKGFIPAAFIPRQNPFYCALPYNDVARGTTKPEARTVIPWFKEAFVEEGKSVCRNRWVHIRNSVGKDCYAQWSDVGPFRTDHWQYVFGDERPKPNLSRGAGLDVSPAVRDYLGLKSEDATDWRFVDFEGVPEGPWALYGKNNDFLSVSGQPAPGKAAPPATPAARPNP